MSVVFPEPELGVSESKVALSHRAPKHSAYLEIPSRWLQGLVALFEKYLCSQQCKNDWPDVALAYPASILYSGDPTFFASVPCSQGFEISYLLLPTPLCN